MGLNKNAMYFTMDALLSAMLILGGFLLISHVIIEDAPVEQVDYLSKDILLALDQISIKDLNNSWVAAEINGGSITNTENSILEQIAAYWSQNETAKAQQLAAIALDGVLPDHTGLRLGMTPDTIYEQLTVPQGGTVIAGRRMISGIEKGQALQGSSSLGYLRTIHDKKSSSYVYFGGFVGQGNITVQLEDIPSDVNASRIKSILLEADLEKNFTVRINGDECVNLTPKKNNYTADSWNLTQCSNSIINGTNHFSISFKGLNNAYIGGGYIRVDYETDTFYTNKSLTTSIYHFPEITGIVNLFDSFYTPGTVNELTVYLHYHTNHTNTSTPFYLTIGNQTVYADTNSTDPVTTTISNTQLSALLDYTLFENGTVPVRLGFENLTYATEYYGNADVVLVTDVSGSMDWNFTHDYSSSTARNCNDPFINELSTQRLSLAKCLDKDFATNILNVTGNQVGLVSYSTLTSSTLPLDTDLTAIYNEIGMGTGTPTGYTPDSSTCICCGINTASQQLSAGLATTTIISSQDEWNYTASYLDGNIPNDGNNRTWYDPDYVLTGNWSTGDAVLGHDAGTGTVSIDTDMGSSLYGSNSVVDLWDMAADTGSPEVDFTSGINSTANTYGATAANDGWDWAGGTFDFTSGMSWYGPWGGRIYLSTPNSGNTDTSGSFAISINITPEQYQTLASNGTAELSFNYWWDDYRNYFENSDQVWIKARWTSPYSGEQLLGEELDVGHSHRDYTPEIATENNPDIDIVNGFYAQDMGNLIEGPGLYYLELGGKLDQSASNEYGWFSFDNILLTVRNDTDRYYLRKEFTLSSLDEVQRGVLNLLEDDQATIYLNGNLLLDDRENNNGTYWDRTGIEVPGSMFRLGQNTLAVELRNNEGSATFDLELIGINDSTKKTLMVMTDGVANRECGQQGWTPDLDGDGWSDTASDDAIQAACDSAAAYGTLIYAVGFSENSDEATLSGIAKCGNGLYRKSSNASELTIFYQDVVLNILEIARQSQSIIITSGTPDSSALYGDSYILINHTSPINPPEPNEIELVFQTDAFNSCEESFEIPQGLRVSEAYVTSYSGDHWTSLIGIDGDAIFNLSIFARNYSRLGDPFVVHVPASALGSGTHNITFATGDDDTNTSGCSKNNSLIYRGFVNSSTSRSSVVELAEGCSWTVDFEDGHNQTFSIPDSYAGAKTCSYTNQSIVYDSRDAYDIAVYTLLSGLDFDGDGRVLINLGEDDLEIIVTLISDVPYLWGPAIVEAELWQ